MQGISHSNLKLKANTKRVSRSRVSIRYYEFEPKRNGAGNRLAVRVRIRLDWRTGATSFDWDSVAKKEHLDQIDTYMERFKSTIKAVTEELKEIRSKEQEMREIAGLSFKWNALSQCLFQRELIHVSLC